MAKPTGGKAGKSDFGKILKSKREAFNMSIADVAREADISPSMLSRIESGEREDLRLSTAARLCEVLQLSLDELAGVKADTNALKAEIQYLKETIKQIEEMFRAGERLSRRRFLPRKNKPRT
jgi:transcriptional regulator with XRE-family HTH domain